MEDPFGEALWEYHQRGEARYLIRRDDGYVDEVDVKLYFQGPEDWPEVERRALMRVRGRILDLGCGAGRHLLLLQSLGHEAVGIDISPLALKVSRERGVEHCVLMDARYLGFRAVSFDSALMMGNNFGIAGDPEKTMALLKDLHRIMRSGGMLIATSIDPLETDNPSHLAYHELNRRRGRPVGLVTIRIEFGDEYSPWFNLWLATPEEMERTAKGAGWRILELHKSHRGLYSAVLIRM